MISRFFPVFGGGYTHICLLSLNIVCWKLIFCWPTSTSSLYLSMYLRHIYMMSSLFILYYVYIIYIYICYIIVYIYIYIHIYIYIYICIHINIIYIYIAYIYIIMYIYIYVLCNIHHFARWLQFSGERLASSSSLSSFRALWASKSPRAAAKRLLQKLRGFLPSGSENEVYIPLNCHVHQGHDDKPRKFGGTILLPKGL